MLLLVKHAVEAFILGGGIVLGVLIHKYGFAGAEAVVKADVAAAVADVKAELAKISPDLAALKAKVLALLAKIHL